MSPAVVGLEAYSMAVKDTMLLVAGPQGDQHDQPFGRPCHQRY